MASGINNTFRQVGIATGIAGLGAIFQHQVTSTRRRALAASGHVHEILVAAHGQLGTLLSPGEVTPDRHSSLPPARAGAVHAYRVGFTERPDDDPLIAAAIALVGAIAGLRAGPQPRLRLVTARARPRAAQAQPSRGGTPAEWRSRARAGCAASANSRCPAS